MRHKRYLQWLSLALVLLVAPRMTSAQKPPAGYAGSAACADCHAKTMHDFNASTMGKLIKDNGGLEHGKLGCESCHGPSKKHMDSGGEERPPMTFSRKSTNPVAERNATCLGCHEKTARTLWKGSIHESRNIACT
jgi:Doubled CXXCH motif (Paired_CXXCH_1).